MEKYSSQEKGLIICACIIMFVGIIASIVIAFLSFGLFEATLEAKNAPVIDWIGVFIAVVTFILSISVKYFFEVIVEISRNLRNKNYK